ncbi:AsmA-like C-terminal region-containing protein [Flavihumibacter profundi]|uniref:AsmA-like C-terminal region-containing protein n=1 Tax=Flavihumibacter profundi TaxID=2716883 RepID=UPI001CC65CAA|nr:AsmA-like C-terminal region-containing protein [Flavihumibacter profundi]MBZ5855812.1 hypothetical protein [Flavihumibacter profundi]
MKKKIVVTIGLLLAILGVFAIAIPFIFSDQLKSMAKEELNRHVNAKAGFRDASLSFFRHFPRVSFTIDQLSIVGADQFKGDTLLSADRIDLAINLFSLFGKGPIEVSAVTFNSPRIHAIIDKSGKPNWDIVKPGIDDSTDAGKSSGFKVKLDKYSINDAFLAYDDDESNMHLRVNQLNHEGSGNFSAGQFSLSTSTTSKGCTFKYNGLPYLLNTNIDLAAIIDINTRESKYTFNKATARLNDIEINAGGFIRLVNDSTYGMDIQFNTPSNEFRNILSLVPAVYQNEFKSLATKGSAAFNGFVKGNYSPRQLPAYVVNLTINDGYFKYPDLPQPVQNINLDLKISNADGQPDNTVIDLHKASLKFGTEPFNLSILYKNPETIRYIDVTVKGKLDLGTVGQFIKLAEGTKLSGQINADLQARGNLVAVLQQKPGLFQANGLLQVLNLSYASEEFPQPIHNTNATIQFSNPDGLADNTQINITNGHTEFGTDKIDFNLLLTHPATDPNFDGSVNGSLGLDRIKQWYSFEPGTSINGHINADLHIKGKKSMVDQKKYESVQTSGKLNIADLNYITKSYPQGFQLKSATLDFNPKEINITAADGSFQQTLFSATGKITNAIGYVLKDEPLTGSLQVKSDKINLNKWMGTTETPKTADTSKSLPFAVPANIHFNLNGVADLVTYDNVNYENVEGALNINNETVTLQNLTMQALGGSILLNGSYSTKVSKTKPAISLNYDLRNLDVEQTFKAYNTVKYLMPVGEFIAGKLNSTLQLNGRLGESMIPDLSSLEGKGMLLLVEGFLSKFKPLEELAVKLNIPELKQISVKDVKQYIEFVNGKVLVKPFKLKVDDIDMEIGGMHGFDQSLDYVINLKIPRAKLGNQVNQLVNSLAADLTKKGIPVQLGETISLKVNMGGSISKPTITYNLQQASASLANEMEQKVKNLAAEQKVKADSLVAETRKAASDSLEMVKKQALIDAEQLIKEQISGKKDSSRTGVNGLSTPKKAEEAAKGLLNNILRKKKNPADSTLKNQ